ncbi:MAG: DUF2184 domain-containing protein [Chloroflexi bacterium]|nr:MAG: DUF2184 domain-containing protein [Chloroflexota bacterium]
MSDVQVTTLDQMVGQIAEYGARPLFNKRMGAKQLGRIVTNRGLHINSLLRKDEWELLDQRIVGAARTRLRGVQDLMNAGLVTRLGSLGVLTTQWNVASEMTAADVTMTGRANGEGDLVDMKLEGRPVPVVFKDFQIGKRYLEAGRLSGNELDTTNAEAAARVVAEKLETMLFSGQSLTFNSDTIYGYTNHPNRNTDTATNYGGGDWGTITNIVPTVLGMVTAANNDNYYGPFNLYVANTQYLQMLETYSDGSGQSALARVLQLPMIQNVAPSDYLSDGNVVLVQMTRDVVDWAYSQDITLLEWMSPDGLVGMFKVLAVATPRVKAEYSGKSGIVHATGA